MEEIINILQMDEAQNILGTREPFANLEILLLEGLPNLMCVCWRALAVPRLKEIRVLECPKLDELPLDSNSSDDNELVIMGREYWWMKLQWKDPAAQLAFHNCFKSIQTAEFELPSQADMEDLSTDFVFELPYQTHQAELQSHYRQSRRFFEESEQSASASDTQNI
ncbi:putative Disease resistance protein family [Melia azedarach]|uniref:Disease resistance protein family n=1 Tax=Melia azedarach TaxID=155640 RepID=A0ACC1Y5A9_MELAZ|nr:putative Disease resistance protein family [Melia azedarach]